MKQSPVTRLRRERTALARRIIRMIAWMQTASAPTQYNGLPSWWAFWSDVLYDNVRDLYRLTRDLNEAEKEK